jgi:hypothetical protein
MDIVKKVKDLFQETFWWINTDIFKEKTFAEYFKQKWAELEKFIAKIIKVYEEKLEKIKNRKIVTLDQTKVIDKIAELNKKIIAFEEQENKYFFSDSEFEVFDSNDPNYDFYDEDDVDELNFTVKLPDDASEILWDELRWFKKLLSEIKYIWKVDMQNKNIYLIDKETCKLSIDQLRTEILYIYLKLLVSVLEKKYWKINKKNKKTKK